MITLKRPLLSITVKKIMLIKSHIIFIYTSSFYSCSSMSSIQIQNIPAVHHSPLTSQKIFKYTNIMTLFILLFCIKGFFNFRQYCTQKGYFVFSLGSLIWCAVGFTGVFIVKYAYYHLMKGTIEATLHPKYMGKQRVHKLKQLLELSFDSLYYLYSWGFGYYLFRNQYWFPQIVGGSGRCDQIQKDYPNWPSNTDKLEMFLMIQLGVSLFGIFEITFFKRKTQRKFHELLLHHCLASSLILFSMMINVVVLTATTLITLNLSNILYVFGYAFMKTKYKTHNNTIILSIFVASIWVYLRVLVFPFCILASLCDNKPAPHDEWHIIDFEYSYIITMSFVLYGLGIFWAYFLIKMAIRSISARRVQNTHYDSKKN